jgi:predicted metalloprotease with PDZ domain
LASRSAWFAHQAARAATPLVDTATANWIIRTVPPGWSTVRRTQDYYDEGALIWLEADALIRRESNGARSLDDFLRAFFGQRDTGPMVVPYTRGDVEAALAAVLPYDWHRFFEERVYQVNAKTPSEAIEATGWRVTYTAVPNADRFLAPGFEAGGQQQFSIGVIVHNDGRVYEVWPGSAADAAGLAPLMSIVAVNGQAFSVPRLIDAIANGKSNDITLVTKLDDSIESRTIKYAGGLRYPHLERIEGTPDRLEAILAPRPVAP